MFVCMVSAREQFRAEGVLLTRGSRVARETDARVQKDTELSDSEDEGMGGRRHRQNHNELQNLINGKRKGKATQSPTGLLSKRSNRPEVSNSPAPEPSRASSSEISGAPTEPQAATSESAIVADASRTVSTGAIVPTSTLVNDDKMDVDPQAVDVELRTEVETGQINNVGTIAKELVAQPDAPAATPAPETDSTVVHPPAYASDSILPIGKHASEVGEDTPEPTTEMPTAE